MTYAEFRSGPAARRRYWARSHVGWARMHSAAPNPGHHALVRLEASGALLHRLRVTSLPDGGVRAEITFAPAP